MKTIDLIGPALDWAVAKCEGRDIREGRWRGKLSSNGGIWKPSETWSQGGPIIEREGVRVERFHTNVWVAQFSDATVAHHGGFRGYFRHTGPTPLIAAMRCYVASKLGDEVNVPKELL